MKDKKIKQVVSLIASSLFPTGYRLFDRVYKLMSCFISATLMQRIFNVVFRT
jgi:hypothetical protein